MNIDIGAGVRCLPVIVYQNEGDKVIHGEVPAFILISVAFAFTRLSLFFP